MQGTLEEVEQLAVQETLARNPQPTTHNHVPMPRLEISAFEGKKPRWWIRKCKRFFQFYQITEDQKINLTVAYLNEVANSWYQGWVQDEGMQGSWANFAEGLCERFGEKSMADIVEEFSKLKQEGTIVEYQARFEELRSIVCTVQPRLTE